MKKWPLEEGLQRVRYVNTTIIEQWTNYCRAGGPGCVNASPDGECCNEGFWRTTSLESEEELLKSKDYFIDEDVTLYFAGRYVLCKKCGMPQLRPPAVGCEHQRERE